MSKRVLLWVIGVVVILAVAVGIGTWRVADGDDHYSVTAHFTSATGVYVGDQVTVRGVPVGKVTAIDPGPTSAAITLEIARDVRLPQTARAAIVAQNLVAGRTVEIVPGPSNGPELDDQGTIPLAQTVVPMEWDDIKNALYDVTDAVAAKGPDDPGSAAELVTSGSDALAPIAEDVNSTIHQLSEAITVVSDGRNDLFGIVRNLQVFVSALEGSNSQIESLQQRLASVADVLGRSQDDVEAAMGSLDAVLGDVQTFVTENRTQLSGSVATATDVSATLAAQRSEIEGLLHQSPTQLANFYNLYKPAVGGMTGVFSVPNFENPVQAVCGGVAALGQPTSQRGADLCMQYLGGYLNTLKTSYPNILTSPTRGTFADPGQLIASEPGVLETVPGLTGPPPAKRTVPTELATLLVPGGVR